MENNQISKLINSNLLKTFGNSPQINGIIMDHILIITQSIAQALNLTIVSNLGFEPWILLALRCFGGLVFLSIVSILSLIREPLPNDNNAKILSYCYSIGQISIMTIYFLCGSIDDKTNYNSILLIPILVILVIYYECKDALFSSEKSLWKIAICMSIIFGSIIIAIISIVNFLRYKSSWIFLIYLFISTAIFVICKVAYYFAISRIDKKKIKPLEVSAISLLSVSKIGIPIGILVHTWRMNELLPTRGYKSFLLDLTRCDRLSTIKILLSSFISFGIVLPLQVLTIPNMSFLEYTIYSISPNFVFSNNYTITGFTIAVLVILNKNYRAIRTSGKVDIQLVG